MTTVEVGKDISAQAELEGLEDFIKAMEKSGVSKRLYKTEKQRLETLKKQMRENAAIPKHDIDEEEDIIHVLSDADSELIIVSANIPKRRAADDSELEIVSFNKQSSFLEEDNDQIIITSVTRKQPECSICFDEIDTLEWINRNTLPCGHSYCTDCISGLFTHSAEDSAKFPVLCAQQKCSQIFDIYLYRDLIKDWDKVERMHMFSMIKNPFYCPVGQCSAVFELEPYDGPEDPPPLFWCQSSCPSCRTGVCLQCKVIFHAGLTCEEYQAIPDSQRSPEDLQMISLAKNNGWAKCPKCSIMVDKSVGCNFIRCRCGCAFCYKCSKPYLSDKVKPNQPRDAPNFNSHGQAGCTCALFDHVAGQNPVPQYIPPHPKVPHPVLRAPHATFNRFLMLQCGGEEITDIESLVEPPKSYKTFKNNTEISCDILIIGAGVVGCALAREMSKYSAKILVIDMADDIASGASKANSGIVHSGYDERHGTLKSKVAHIGNQLFRKLDLELHFGFREVGSLVVAFSEDQLEDLQRLYENGKKNGVTKLELISGDEARRREPSLSKHVFGAMYCPHTGVTSPYEYAIAFAENAIYNGVDFMLGHKVVSIERVDNHWVTRCTHGTTNLKFVSPVVVNCAGINSDKIAAMVSKPFFKIVPRKGEYLLLDRTQAHLVKHVLFPVPSKKKGKGILVSPTYWGNVLLGPTSREQNEVMTSTQVLQHIIQSAMKLIPDLDVKHAITSYSGFRAKTSIADFILQETPDMFLNMAGIDSPGLTSSPALAILASKQIIEMFEKIGGNLRENLSFNPSRPSIIIPKNISFKGRIDDEDPSKNIICRCERITEAEILDSMRRPIAAKTMNAVKRRTRAGMGICQGAFCEPRIIKIIAKEFDIPEIMVKRIEKPSSLLPHVRLTPEDKDLLSTLASDKSSKM